MAPSKKPRRRFAGATRNAQFVAIACPLAAFTLYIGQPINSSNVSEATIASQSDWGQDLQVGEERKSTQWFGCRRLRHSNQSNAGAPRKNKKSEWFDYFKKWKQLWNAQRPHWVRKHEASRKKDLWKILISIKQKWYVEEVETSRYAGDSSWTNSSSRRAIFSQLKPRLFLVTTSGNAKLCWINILLAVWIEIYIKANIG